MKSHFSTRALSGATALLGLSFAFSGAPVSAQTAPGAQPSQADLDALRAQIADLQKRLDAMEAAQKAAPAATPAPASAPTPVTNTNRFPVTINGLFQVQSLNYLDETRKTSTNSEFKTGLGNGSNDTFRLRRSEIRISLPAITNRLSGFVNFDVARAASTTTPGTFQGQNNNILQDLQISFLATKPTQKTSQVFLDAGQFKIPLGYESALTPTSQVSFLERSLIFTGRDPFGTTYGDQRDTGIQIRAIVPQLEARLGLFNGFGDRQNSLAVRDEKAVVGLLAFRPRALSGLTIGASGGIGNTGETFTSGSTTVTVPTLVNGVVTGSTQITIPGTTTDVNANRNIVNAFLVFRRPNSKFTFQSEFLRGHSAPLTITNGANVTPVIAANPQGFYIGGSYFITPKFEALLRYDTLDFDHKQPGFIVRDYILGANYYIKGQNKVQINLVRRVGGANAPTNTNPAANYRNNRFELRSGVQLAF